MATKPFKYYANMLLLAKEPDFEISQNLAIFHKAQFKCT